MRAHVLLVVGLAMVLAACGDDPTAPKAAAGGPCWAYSDLTASNGSEWRLWVHYNECPSADELADDGFQRGER